MVLFDVGRLPVEAVYHNGAETTVGPPDFSFVCRVIRKYYSTYICIYAADRNLAGAVAVKVAPRPCVYCVGPNLQSVALREAAGGIQVPTCQLT